MTELDLDLTPEPPSPAPAVLVARQQRALLIGLGGGRECERERERDGADSKASFAERRMRATDTAPMAAVPELPAGAAGVGTGRGMGAGAGAGRGADTGTGMGNGAGPCVGAREGARQHPGAGAGVGASAQAGAGAGAREEGGRGAEAGVDANAIASASANGSVGASPDVRAGSGTPTRRAMPDGAPMRPRPATTAMAMATTQVRLDDALVVPAGALIRGYLRCRALLLVGDIVGNVHCTAGPVVIRSGASLKGRLVASGDVYVCGAVGDSGGGAVISTRGKLTLAPGARVDGDVRSGRLDVYDGATLRGVARASED